MAALKSVSPTSRRFIHVSQSFHISYLYHSSKKPRDPRQTNGTTRHHAFASIRVNHVPKTAPRPTFFGAVSGLAFGVAYLDWPGATLLSVHFDQLAYQSLNRPNCAVTKARCGSDKASVSLKCNV